MHPVYTRDRIGVSYPACRRRRLKRAPRRKLETTLVMDNSIISTDLGDGDLGIRNVLDQTFSGMVGTTLMAEILW